MSKSLSYNRHGFTLVLLSLCLMIIVFLGITLSTVFNRDYVKKVVTSDTNVSLIRSYTNQKLGRLVNSYSSVGNLSATDMSEADIKKIISASVDDVYDDDTNLTIGDVILETIGDNLKRTANKNGLNIDSEIDSSINANKGIMNQIIEDDIGPIESMLTQLQTMQKVIKMTIIISGVIFVLLALRLWSKVGSTVMFLHHLGTVGIITSILLALLLAGTYYPLQDLIASNIEYNIRDVLYNILNGIFLSYISIVFMLFILSILDWGSTTKYKYR